MPHVIATTRFVGTQYQKTKPGSRFNVEQIVIENSEDPNVPIGGKLIPYNTSG
jgi:branched-chain amino acid transport system substrate-binding protein